MRRILTVLAPAVALALALAVPGVASAHGARHHRRHHHARGARVIKLTPVQGSKAAAQPGTPTTTESVGTVSSYEKEVLTIKLTDGSLLSGKVTPQTRVICVSGTPTPETSSTPTPGWNHGHGRFGWRHHGNSCAEPSSSEGSASPGSSNESGSSPWQGNQSGGPWQGHQSGGNSRGDCFQGKESKEEVNLEKVFVAGATVDEAELRITPEGAIWDSVVINK